MNTSGLSITVLSVDNGRMGLSTSRKLLCGPSEGVLARNGAPVCYTLTQLRQF